MEKMLQLIAHHISFYKSVEKVVLFGSRARGDHTERSDYDIAIFGDIDYKDASDIRYFLDEGICTLRKIDVIFVQFLKENDKILQNILTEGIVIYDRKQN